MSTRWSGEAPINIEVYRSRTDGSLVVDIDQEASDDMRICVLLNDGLVFDGNTKEVSVLAPDEARHMADELEIVWDSGGDLAQAVIDVISFLRTGDTDAT